jgi:hypothetical protein
MEASPSNKPSGIILIWSSSPACRKRRAVDGERFTDQTMKRSTLKRIAIALAIISLILIQAYLESSLGFTPNH